MIVYNEAARFTFENTNGDYVSAPSLSELIGNLPVRALRNAFIVEDGTEEQRQAEIDAYTSEGFARPYANLSRAFSSLPEKHSFSPEYKAMVDKVNIAEKLSDLDDINSDQFNEIVTFFTTTLSSLNQSYSDFDRRLRGVRPISVDTDFI
jgi:hypothetical protein